MTAAIIYTIGLMALAIGAWYVCECAKKHECQRAKYEALYKHIQNSISDDHKKEWQPYINTALNMLRELPYKNPEKTEVLYNEFAKKYYTGFSSKN